MFEVILAVAQVVNIVFVTVLDDVSKMVCGKNATSNRMAKVVMTKDKWRKGKDLMAKVMMAKDEMTKIFRPNGEFIFFSILSIFKFAILTFRHLVQPPNIHHSQHSKNLRDGLRNYKVSQKL